ncbi:MAG: sigma-54-dependent Fis family transcriptional regulator, partial [Candidatus Riflebacteria bacterium]|nr:sigma-54-dependent Fis family transcriptional regulator [Candidatus Riflebacteria bacterium]
DVRILGATHKDLRREVAEGRFREDLFYRINVFALHIPPLRERPEDVPLLVSHFIGIFNQKMGRSIRGVQSDALELLKRYPWPGTVRELRNVVERAFVLEPTDLLTPSSLPLDLAGGALPAAVRENTGRAVLPEEPPAAQDGPDSADEQALLAAAAAGPAPTVLELESLPRDFESAKDEFERLFLRAAIRRLGGNISEVARETGISRRHIYRRMKSLGL